MKTWRGILGAICLAAGCGCLSAQTPPPLLGSIEAPYAPLQSTAKIGGTAWAVGVTAYGPVGTPLVIYGANLGGDGVVQFIAYKNGAVDTSVGVNGIFNATVTLWTSNMLITTVPSGAYSGLVKVFVEGQYSNPLPFLVTGGVYAGTCPAGPPTNQLQITTTALPDGQVSHAYSATLYSSGGTGNITWTVASGTLPVGLTLNQPSGGNPATITGTPTATTGTNPAALTFRAADSASPQNTDESEITLTVTAQSMTQAAVYSYSLSYDYAGNVTQFKDATYNNGPGIMGTWNITGPGGGAGYDNLNRLTNASAAWPDGTTQYFCWQYDAYGNRLEQEFSSAQFQSGSGGAGACTPQSNATLATDLSSYDTNNRVTSTNARGVTATPGYDAAGDMQSDGANTYLYDGEGRVCAVSSTLEPGYTTLTGYLYDAEGNRVAKGSITTMSCNPATNGFQFTEDYVTGPGGEELSMLNGSGTWQRTNVYGGGKLIGTYDLVHNPAYTPNGSQPAQVPWLHLHFEDALGTRRMQISGMLANLAQPEMDFQSLPYGDNFAQFQDPYADETYDDSSPLHFTGKEHDTESGNDYFGARYYASSMGRWLSPDWSAKIMPVPYVKLDNPQSLNLYNYIWNNPLTRTDPTGHYNTSCTSKSISGCSKDVQNFEANRQKDLHSKDARVRSAAAAYGGFNDGNKVNLKFDPNATSGMTKQDFRNGRVQDTVTVTLPSTAQKDLVAHEGSHVEDFNAVMSGGASPTHYQGEIKAYETQAATLMDDYPTGTVGDPASMTINDGNASMVLIQPFDKTSENVDQGAIKDFLPNAPHYHHLSEDNQGGPAFVKP